MIRLTSRALAASALALALLSPSAYSGVAERATQTKAGSIDLIVYPMDIKEMVTVHGAIPLGNAFDPASGVSPIVPPLMAQLLSAGTRTQDKFAIADQLEQIGASIEFGATRQALIVEARCLRGDLPKVLKLMAEQLRSPRFAPQEVQQAKAIVHGNLMQQAQDTATRAHETALTTVYAPQSANRPVPVAEMAKAAAKVTPAEIAAFHKKYVGPAHMTLVFTGDVDAKAIQAEVGKAFAGWQGGMDFVRGKQPKQAPSQRAIAVPMPDKANVALVGAQGTGLMTSDADFLPLQLGTAILGRGFTSRLMGTVRDQEGLTYDISASLNGSDFTDGALVVDGSFAPELLAKGKASTLREVKRWHEGGVTDAELAARKTNFVGLMQVGMGTTGGMAAVILDHHLQGKPLSELDTYPDRVRAVTKDQVDAAIKSRIDPQQMVWVEAGTLPK